MQKSAQTLGNQQNMIMGGQIHPYKQQELNTSTAYVARQC